MKKIPQRDPVATCGEAITMEDFEDEKIIAESRGPGQTPKEAMARLRQIARRMELKR
jgi:hypothetical protein